MWQLSSSSISSSAGSSGGSGSGSGSGCNDWRFCILCECEQKMLPIHRPATLISYLLMWYRVNANKIANTMTKCYAHGIPDIMIYTCVPAAGDHFTKIVGYP